MVQTLRLTVVTGPHKGRKFCFCGPTRCLVGRADECFVQLCGTDRDWLISRQHCQLIVEPPVLVVSDLGSTNGTFLNGKRVSLETVDLGPATSPQEACERIYETTFLTIGGTTFQVELVECPPPGIADPGQPSPWQGGLTAIRDCPIACK